MFFQNFEKLVVLVLKNKPLKIKNHQHKLVVFINMLFIPYGKVAGNKIL